LYWWLWLVTSGRKGYTHVPGYKPLVTDGDGCWFEGGSTKRAAYAV